MIVRDGDWILFDHEPVTGRTVWFLEDELGNVTFRVEMHVDAILDENAEHLNASQNKRFGDWERVASIPHNILYDSGLDEALNEGDKKFASRWLNDSDNRKFRTFRGNV